MNLRPAVFLDRDGVLNQAIVKEGKPYPPASLDELVVPEEVLPALNQLKLAGFLLIGATNQPDVARGTTSKALVESINAHLLNNLPLQDILVCYHDDSEQCDCRKPRAGLLLQAARDYQLDLSKSYMIGDRWRDIEAGNKAGCRSIWLDRGCLEKRPVEIFHRVTSLSEAAGWILQQKDGFIKSRE